MTDLTDKWKKGELPEGDYFLDIGNDIIIDYWVCNHWNWIEYDSRIKEVLCECPTYEEYQALLSDQLAKKEGEEINAELVQKMHILNEANMKLENEVGKFGEENKKLKKLLKELFETCDLSYCDEELLEKIEEITR